MRLGIDYGTTRTVVCAIDKGNYPIVSFQNQDGDDQDWYPSVIAVLADKRAFGFEAVARQSDPGWEMLRSFKRQLASLSPDSAVRAGGRPVTVLQLLTEFMSQLRTDLIQRSNLRISRNTPLEAMISVPANSNSNQRFITLEAFRRAGFKVRGMINEPSAAGIEYAHTTLTSHGSSRREHVVIYDLGGGTFDASVINIVDQYHEVLNSVGISQLGGDDFDALLLDLALRRAAVDSLTGKSRFHLLEECRERKEGLHANTRKIAIDMGRAVEGKREVVIDAQEFYASCRPLVERTVAALERAVLLAPLPHAWDSVAAIYMVGGSSDFPLVSRLLREQFGRRVRKSSYPHAATAIGLAIMADSTSGYTLRERFTRHFGVWRELDDGRSVTLDVLFEQETLLPQDAAAKVVRSRLYRPVHNIGHFRYLECGQIDEAGRPGGDITPWDEIYFPFDPTLQNEENLDRIPVTRNFPPGQLVEELYTCDAGGIIEVTIVNHASQFRRSYRLRGKR
jgi:molecular chaperone DnaK (HSP70)